MNDTLSKIEAAQFRRKAQNHAMTSNLMGAIIVFIVFGPMMQLYATDVLQLTATRIGAIIGFLPLIALVRFVLFKHIRKLGGVRVIQAGCVVQIGALSALIFTPERFTGFWLLLSVLFVYALAREISMGAMWQPLLRQITSNEDRGQFFSRMRFLFSLINLIAIGLITLWISGALQPWQYKVLLAVAILGLINRIFWIGKVPEDKQEHADNPQSLGFARLWRVARTSPLLCWPMLMLALLCLVSMPMIPVYFLKVLNFPAQLVTASVFLTTLSLTLSYLVWGKVADTLGYKPLMIGMLVMSILAAPSLLFIAPFQEDYTFTLNTLTPQIMLSLIAAASYSVFLGIYQSGKGLAETAIQHYHVSNEDSLEAMSIFTLVQQFCLAMAAFIAGILIDDLAIPHGVTSWVNGLIYFDYFRGYVVFVVPIVMIIAMLMMRKIPNSRPAYGMEDFVSFITNAPIRTILLSRRVHHESKEKRMSLARFLGQANNPLGAEALIELTRDPSFDVKVEAVRSLGMNGSAEGAERLMDILRYNRHVGDHAAWALGEMRYKPAVELLIEKLGGNASIRVRAMAARALGLIGDYRAVDPIHQLMMKTEELHVLSSCVVGLISLDARKHAVSMFTSMNRLYERTERYEIMYQLCDWLDIPSDWLLRITVNDRPALMLLLVARSKSSKWIEARQIIINDLENADHQAMIQHFDNALSTRDRPTNELEDALLKAANAQEDWSLVSVLMAAWLLLKK